MVQFLSINFFSWISSIFVGFFKSSRFFVSPCIKKQMSETIYEMVCESKVMYGIEVRGLSEAWKELYKVHRDFARN